MTYTTKYKHLRGGARSFTEGFTGIINGCFAALGSYAATQHVPDFRFDLLSREAQPHIPEPWLAGLFDYLEPHRWLPSIGVAYEHVTSFTITVHFDLATVKRHDYGTSSEESMRFTADTAIIDDRERHHEWHEDSTVFFNDRNA